MRNRNLIFSILVAFATVFATGSLLAQDFKPKREVGLQFSSLDFDGGSGFSAFYKKQKKENVYRRIRFFSGSLSAVSVDEDFNFNFAAGIAIGREKRKSLDSKLEFYQGPEVSVGLGIAAINELETNLNISAGFGWVLGLQHSFNERWAVNLETIPKFSLATNLNGDSGADSVVFGAGFNNSVSIGLVRKF
jgi:hypothetical protein